MVIHIKNMVCLRCKMAVQSVLEKLGVAYKRIDLGQVELNAPLNPLQQKELNKGLLYFDLELIEDKKRILIEQIKTLLVELLHFGEMPAELKMSAYLSEKLHYNYTYLASTFSEAEGITLEHFYIDQKVERVKELMMYEDLTLTEISYRLHYSSLSHLCLQFKKVTGTTPGMYKKLHAFEENVWKT